MTPTLAGRSSKLRSYFACVTSPFFSRSALSQRLVRPTAVTEKSLMESVAGFINEVQAINLHGSSSSSPSSSSFAHGGRDPKVNVTWARFEVADINDVRLFSEGGGDVNGENCFRNMEVPEKQTNQTYVLAHTMCTMYY